MRKGSALRQVKLKPITFLSTWVVFLFSLPPFIVFFIQFLLKFPVHLYRGWREKVLSEMENNCIEFFFFKTASWKPHNYNFSFEWDCTSMTHDAWHVNEHNSSMSRAKFIRNHFSGTKQSWNFLIPPRKCRNWTQLFSISEKDFFLFGRGKDEMRSLET